MSCSRKGGVAARRGAAFSNADNDLGCPTGETPPIDKAGKKPRSSNRNSSEIFGKYVKPAHKRMSRMLGFALAESSPHGWRSFADVAAARLSLEERGSLAFAALHSMSSTSAEMTAAAALTAAGAPLPAFLGDMTDARDWASLATRDELRAYCLAAFEAMDAQDQAAFYQHISKIEVAA